MQIAKWRNHPILQSVIIGIRFLIGLAFIPAGMVKIYGERFTRLSIDTPVGYFFEALFQSGLYWNFLGLAQLIAAFLLFTQRFATIGAMIFFGIITNIFMITISLDFKNTWIITILLLIASLLLLIWDYPKLLPLFKQNMENLEITEFKEPSKSIEVIGLISFILIVGLIIIGRIFFVQ